MNCEELLRFAKLPFVNQLRLLLLRSSSFKLFICWNCAPSVTFLMLFSLKFNDPKKAKSLNVWHGTVVKLFPASCKRLRRGMCLNMSSDSDAV